MPATTTALSPLAVQMPRELAKAMQRLAEKHDRTVQHEIRAALRAHVDRETEESPPTNP